MYQERKVYWYPGNRTRGGGEYELADPTQQHFTSLPPLHHLLHHLSISSITSVFTFTLLFSSKTTPLHQQFPSTFPTANIYPAQTPHIYCTKCLTSSTFPPLQSTHLSSSTIPHLYTYLQITLQDLTSTEASTSKSDVLPMNAPTSLAPSCTTLGSFFVGFPSSVPLFLFFFFKLLPTVTLPLCLL